MRRLSPSRPPRVRRPAPRAARLLLPLLLTLPSCLELEQTITLQTDGSGTQDVLVGLSETTLATLQRSAAAATGSSTTPDALFDERRVRTELEQAGLELQSFRSYHERQRRWAKLCVAFDSIDELRRNPLCGTRATWTFAPGKVPGTIRACWYPQGAEAWQEARDKAAALAAKPDEITRGYFEKRRRELHGLRVVLHLDLPGDVIDCCAALERDGARRVTARIDADDVRTPQDLVLLLAPRYEVTFQGKGCTLPLQAEEGEHAPRPRPNTNTAAPR